LYDVRGMSVPVAKSGDTAHGKVAQCSIVDKTVYEFCLGVTKGSLMMDILSDCVPSLKGMPRFVEERRQKVNLLLGLYVLLCYCSSNSISSGSSITTTSPASVEADHLPIENFPPDIGPVQVLRRLCKRERYPGK